MSKFTDNTKPTTSPWGPLTALSLENVATGIWRIDTLNHGGYFLSAERKQNMPPALRDCPTYLERKGDDHTGQWYEEDYDWALVCLSFPEDFTRKFPEDGRDNVRKMAINVVRAWHSQDLAVRAWLNEYVSVNA